MINVLAPFRIAMRAIRVHKVRSILTILGLMIGVMSIIIVLNMGQGLKGFVYNQMKVFGTDFLQVEVKVPSTSKTSSENAMGMAQGITITTLKMADAEVLARHPNIRGYYVMQIGQDVVSNELDKKTTLLWGVSADFFNLYQSEVVEGRSFTEEEDKSQAQVVVIGPGLKKKFFPSGSVIGEKIKIGNKKFTVIGIMEEQGNYFGVMDLDSVVYMPVRTLQKKILGIDHVSNIIAYMRDPNLASQTAEDFTAIMRQQHDISDPNKDDFAVTTMEEAMGMMDTVLGAVTLLLIAIAAISLVVGGVGIMNVMYVSVSERTYEIGLRKAVGATKNNILWQFLWEAIFLTSLGGLSGVILGSFFSLISVIAARSYGLDWGYNFSWFGIILGVGFSAGVGLVFGLYPARQAANLEPVEALRFE